MKKLIFNLIIAFMTTLCINAQQISVVSSSGATTIYRTIQDAVDKAAPGSVVYLPGGGFGGVTITKKLTVIGIGHYIKGENVDGITSINGDFTFGEGSDGSAIMGCYITGKVNVSANDILIRYCNFNGLNVTTASYQGTIVNQNYIRNYNYCSDASVEFSNNIMYGYIRSNSNGLVKNNVFENNGYRIFSLCHNLQIVDNIFFSNRVGLFESSDNLTYSGNMGYYIECEYQMTDIDWNDVFENYNNGAISPASKFHFKGDYKKYENICGIYAGSGFNDDQLAPAPYIVAKQIDDHTDTQGMLNVKFRVKANQ